MENEKYKKHSSAEEQNGKQKDPPGALFAPFLQPIEKLSKNNVKNNVNQHHERR
jgi:hypothetical protein